MKLGGCAGFFTAACFGAIGISAYAQPMEPIHFDQTDPFFADFPIQGAEVLDISGDGSAAIISLSDDPSSSVIFRLQDDARPATDPRHFVALSYDASRAVLNDTYYEEYRVYDCEGMLGELIEFYGGSCYSYYTNTYEFIDLLHIDYEDEHGARRDSENSAAFEGRLTKAFGADATLDTIVGRAGGRPYRWNRDAVTGEYRASDLGTLRLDNTGGLSLIHI